MKTPEPPQAPVSAPRSFDWKDGWRAGYEAAVRDEALALTEAFRIERLLGRG